MLESIYEKFEFYINIAYAIPLFGFAIGLILMLITAFLGVKYTCVDDKKASIFEKIMIISAIFGCCSIFTLLISTFIGYHYEDKFNNIIKENTNSYSLYVNGIEVESNNIDIDKFSFEDISVDDENHKIFVVMD
jgi:hypothetical protein